MISVVELTKYFPPSRLSIDVLCLTADYELLLDYARQSDVVHWESTTKLPFFGSQDGDGRIKEFRGENSYSLTRVSNSLVPSGRLALYHLVILSAHRLNIILPLCLFLI